MAKTFVQFTEYAKAAKDKRGPVFIDPDLVAAVRPTTAGVELTVGRAAAVVVLEPLEDVLKMLSGPKREQPQEKPQEKKHEQKHER